MTETATSFGIVDRDERGTSIYGTNLSESRIRTLADWARYVVWPCSQLARIDDIAVRFDLRGDLVDLSVTPDDADPLADELNAWTSECLVRAGYPSHPAIRP